MVVLRCLQGHAIVRGDFYYERSRFLYEAFIICGIIKPYF
jgi:hypothetical protein